ncbi:MAG TPA: protein kinase [Gemmatimonadales bacterium]|nr:protein kinase [Gemmatimonadales bacterium]
MTDTPSRLTTALSSRYTIERELGAGGMATVYLAADLKHDRKVAIKVLRPELAAVIGAERFLREIKTIATLQHPHILGLIDSGEVNGTAYYVMPFVEGESLRDRLTREKQLPIPEAVRIATEVASALNYAHRHQVIHRDIKPENILLHDGQALVADFGIALAVSSAGGTRMTETGMSLGTPHYMSPEQAMGERTLDARSDIYALGCVTYEMLIGEPPFTGPTAQAIVAKVMNDEPRPPSKLRKSVPPTVEAAVLTALDKLPADRFGSAAEFAAALVSPGSASYVAWDARHRVSTPVRRWLSTGIPWVVTAAALVVAILSRTSSRPDPVTRFQIAFPDGEAIRPVQNLRIAVSRDGRSLVYTGPDSTGSKLWVRDFDRLDSRPLPGTAGGEAPFFSPDGRSIGFTRGGALAVVSATGGPVHTLVGSAVDQYGADWGPDDRIYYASVGRDVALWRVSPNGGAPEKAFTFDSGLGARELDYVSVLPNGKGALLLLWKGSSYSADLEAISFSKKTARTLLRGVSFARYAAPGFIVYGGLDGTAFAAPFDQARLELTGPATTLLEDVTVDAQSVALELAVSSEGTLVYQRAGAGGGDQPVWVDRKGAVRPVDPGWTGSFGSLALSPDGAWLAATVSSVGEQDIWVKQLDRGPLTRLTFGGENYRPTWTSDGKSVAFVIDRGDSSTLWVKPADGSAEARRLRAPGQAMPEGEFSNDGHWLIYRVGGTVGNRDLYAMRLGVDSPPIPLVTSPADEWEPKLSPDGRWLAYVSDESGREEVYVRPFPNASGGKWQVSVGGGAEPVWSPTGRELFYRGTSEFIVVQVAVTATATFQVRGQQPLFPAAPFVKGDHHAHYAVSRDGQQFVMIHRIEAAGGTPLIWVHNWSADLKQRGQN